MTGEKRFEQALVIVTNLLLCHRQFGTAIIHFTSCQQVEKTHSFTVLCPGQFASIVDAYCAPGIFCKVGVKALARSSSLA